VAGARAAAAEPVRAVARGSACGAAARLGRETAAARGQAAAAGGGGPGRVEVTLACVCVRARIAI
jgi:hypothetical protein